MREFVAETEGAPGLRAWLYPEDPDDDIHDPLVPRDDGWRIVIERIGAGKGDEPVRSTWEPTLREALKHADLHWPSTPKWRDYATGEAVEFRVP